MQHINVSFRSTNRGKNPLSYCGANIWNYILYKVNPKSAIGSFKKLIQNLFLLSNDNLSTWFRTCCCIIAPLISMFSTCVYMCKLQLSEYICMGMCTYIHMYLKVHAGSLTCKDSALLHRFYVLHPWNTVTSLLDIGAHKPWLQAPFARFILFTHVICIIYFVNLLMMNCISLGNKEYFIVIVIVKRIRMG